MLHLVELKHFNQQPIIVVMYFTTSMLKFLVSKTIDSGSLIQCSNFDALITIVAITFFKFNYFSFQKYFSTNS